MRKIILPFIAFLLIYSAQAQPYNNSIDSIPAAVSSVSEDTNFINNNYFDSRHSQRIAPSLSSDFDANVLLSSRTGLS
ncbi:MAG TPA: hypothetical protein VGB84_01960, partial [Arachidicoccus sp.]